MHGVSNGSVSYWSSTHVASQSEMVDSNDRFDTMKTIISNAAISSISGSMPDRVNPAAILVVALMHGIRIGSETGRRRKTIRSLFPSENISNADVRQPSNEKPIAPARKTKRMDNVEDICNPTLRKTVAETIRVNITNVRWIRQ
jgi:hypothetical protein